jgi:hypothetical protein
MTRFSVPGFTLCLLTAGSALMLCLPLAAAPSQGDFERCAALAQAAERLECYDGLLPPAANDRESRQAPDRAAGGSLPAPRDSGSPSREAAEPPASSDIDSREEAAEPTSFAVVVINVRESASRKLIYVTKEGQVWEQIDSHDPVYRDFPFTAEIRQAAFGSYLLRSEHYGASIRVRLQK